MPRCEASGEFLTRTREVSLKDRTLVQPARMRHAFRPVYLTHVSNRDWKQWDQNHPDSSSAPTAVIPAALHNGGLHWRVYKVIDDREKIPDIERFGDVAVHPGLQAEFSVAYHRVSGHRNDGDVLAAHIFA